MTALLGDSNGDFAVNVMDVIHDVDYILGMNPQPFIFNAADVNNDLMINVLDVVGTVDIILNPVAGGTTVNAMAGPNYYPNTPVGGDVEGKTAPWWPSPSTRSPGFNWRLKGPTR